MKRYLSSLLALLAITPGIAFAATITSATVYQNIPDPSNAGDSANFAAGLASANFTIGAAGINFLSDSTYTVAPFLNNPTFTNQVNGFNPNASIGAGTPGGIELVITGLIGLNAGSNSFVLGHDDGAVLSINGIGTVLNVPGPSGYTLTPFAVNATSAGNYAFTLEYAECCGAPADLTFAINNVVVTGAAAPEPSSLVLLGTGAFAAAAAVRRRFRYR